MSLRDVLALPRKVLRREKERMEMTERMDDGVRDHECANEHVPACERGKEKGGDALVSRLSRCSFRRGIIGGESSRATIREFEWRCLT